MIEYYYDLEEEIIAEIVAQAKKPQRDMSDMRKSKELWERLSVVKRRKKEDFARMQRDHDMVMARLDLELDLMRRENELLQQQLKRVQPELSKSQAG